MDDSSSDIETYLPDLGAFRLDEVIATANRTLRRAASALVGGATRADEPQAGFASSAASFGETGAPERRIQSTASQPADESAEFPLPTAGFSSAFASVWRHRSGEIV